MESRNNRFIRSESAPQPAPGKKTYQKPEIIYLAPLEAMAVVCGGPGKADIGMCSFTES
jgi:hypothetical protein